MLESNFRYLVAELQSTNPAAVAAISEWVRSQGHRQVRYLFFCMDSEETRKVFFSVFEVDYKQGDQMSS
jgi:hypothetical protein